MPRIRRSSSAISARAPASGTALSRKRVAFCSIAASVSRNGFFWRGIGRVGGRQRQGMDARQRVGHRGKLVGQTRRAAVDAGRRSARRPAGRDAARSRRADGGVRPARREMAEGFGLRREARGCRGIAFMRIGDARQRPLGKRTWPCAVPVAGNGFRSAAVSAENAGRSRRAASKAVTHCWGARPPVRAHGDLTVIAPLEVARPQHQPLRGILPSFSRGISSAKLQGRNRMSSCWRRMSSQPSLQAPVEPGRAKM